MSELGEWTEWSVISERGIEICKDRTHAMHQFYTWYRNDASAYPASREVSGSDWGPA